MKYYNYHCHNMYGNPISMDVIVSMEDYCKRAKELGHDAFFTTCHGLQGDIFQATTLAHQYDLKMIVGAELYYVPDRFSVDENGHKDRSNRHIIIIALNHDGIRDLNRIISESFETGMYYKPRIDKELLFSLNPDNVVITTACVAGLWDDEELIIEMKKHFKNNLFLEVQDHNEEIQKKVNRKVLQLAQKHNIRIIHANDSHYIYPEDTKYRDLFLKAKGIIYEQETNFILDYPDYDEIIKRYEIQGVLNKNQINEALQSTNVFQEVDCSDYINDEIKLPSVSENPNSELKRIINESWIQDRERIPKEKWKEYLDAIRYEVDIIEKTNMANYFLIDYNIAKIAKEKYGGVLTNTGRGCFTGDALVHTLKGIKPLKKVEIGDYVVTEDGRFNKVLNTFSYDIREPMIKIKHLYGTDKYYPTICTRDHKILIYRNGNREWIEAQNIVKGDYVCVPKIKFKDNHLEVIDLNDYNDFGYRFDDNFIYEEYDRSNKRYNKTINRYIQIDRTFNEFIGLMYGDGFNNSTKNCDVGLAINTETDKDSINKMIFYNIANRLGVSVYENPSKDKKLNQLYIHSKIFNNFIKKELFQSKKGKDKEFNPKWFNQSKKMIEGIIFGLRNSDGSKATKTGQRISFDNTSLSIANAYKLMCLYTECGVNSLSIRPIWDDKRGYRCKESYKLRINPNAQNTKKISERVLEDKEYYYLPVKEIERIKKQSFKVYDLEVENNHSYLINNMVVHNSAPSFYTTKLLHLTNIDRLESPITLFPTRFMSIERILGARSLPDIDLNTADAEPFIQASKDLLGENNCGWMISWKPLQESSGFRLYCKALDIDYDTVNEVAKDLDKYRDDPKWAPIIEESKRFIGVVEGVSESPCFVKGTKIKTSKGYKNIENLNTSDLVLTHNNQYRQVIRTMSHEVDNIIELKNMGSLPIKTTFNHPFYIRKHIGRKYFLENNKYKSVRKFTNPYWEQASNLTKGDYVGMPVNSKSIIPQWEGLDLSNENVWWIIGRYIGDGWLRLIKKGKNHGQSYHTLICCSKKDNEQQEIEEKISKCFNYTKTEEKTTYKYDISLKALYSYLETFGCGAKGKYLIEDVYNLPIYLLKAFLEGYQSADGYSPKDRNDIFYTSISYDLILGLQNCVHKCYKVPTTIVCRKKENIKSSVLSDGREIVAKNDVYILSFRLNGNRYDGFFEDNYMWLPFRYKKEIIESNIVYNISVRDDESYTINNIAVHNCSMLLYDKDVRSEIGMIKTPNGKICCMLDGYNCDKYKYLKNDYLTVTVWAIIRDVCKLANIEIPTINELNNLLDDKTFDVYQNGLTCSINQADSDYATGLVMRYKPKSLAEMSSFVAIIRPGCASLLDDFIERKPYTTGVKALDNILEDSEHRLIYQESIMKYLIWLGISEPQSYDVIKKIAKKKFKEPELKALKEQLLEGWHKQVGEEKGFEETWKVVEDAAKYSFNASHSLSYAYDSLYGAYLKSHYPLEYYTVALNYYSNDASRTGKLTSELKYYGITLEKPKFRYSKDEYFMDKEHNKIYKGTGAIKFLNKECSLYLYSLRENKYDTFTDLLAEITEAKDDNNKAYINSRQIDILIQAQYFQEFGHNKKLAQVYEQFKNLYGRKLISKDKFKELNIPEYALQCDGVTETEKQFKFENICDIIKLIERTIPDESFGIKEQVAFEMDVLGYISMTYDVDKKVCYVVDVDTKYTPRINLYCLNNGKSVLCKINKTTFKNNPLKKGQVIKALKFEERYKQVKVNDTWQKTNDKEWWLSAYKLTTIEEETNNEN
ncbi:MAG: PHP domain-containing protein [Clostridium sp.]|nr:PHP domain-containing protein [Clostridium sp.]